MRSAKLSTIVEGGFLGSTSGNYLTKNLSAWTHWYHKPYANDWAEARAKAKEKLAYIGDKTTDGEFYNMMRDKSIERAKERKWGNY